MLLPRKIFYIIKLDETSNIHRQLKLGMDKKIKIIQLQCLPFIKNYHINSLYVKKTTCFLYKLIMQVLRIIFNILRAFNIWVILIKILNPLSILMFILFPIDLI